MISEMGVGVVSWILVSVITGVLYPISWRIYPAYLPILSRSCNGHHLL
jgi:hypothetical protein